MELMSIASVRFKYHTEYRTLDILYIIVRVHFCTFKSSFDLDILVSFKYMKIPNLVLTYIHMKHTYLFLFIDLFSTEL